MGNLREPARSEDAKAAVAPEPRVGASTRLLELQRTIGNAAVGRLLRAQVPARQTPTLSSDEPMVIAREFEVPPLVPKMEAQAEREYDQPSSPRNFSSDPTPETLPGSLRTGDHIWYWNGHVSAGAALPRTTWWPDSPGKQEYHHPGEAGHGKEIYNFVIRDDRVVCGQPHMNNPTGSFAWLNNNPGNLSGIAGKTQGIGEALDSAGQSQLNGAPPDTPLFLVFPTYDAGLDAIPRWLARNGPPYTTQTIADAWQGYDAGDAPKYVKLIEAALGVSASTKILGSLSPEQWETLKQTIRTAEGTILGWTYSRKDQRLPKAIRDAL